MTLGGIGLQRPAPLRAAIFAACLLAANSAYAVEGAASVAAADPITIYTEDAAARAPGGAAEQLLRRAREQGEVRVIVGLRIVMRMEDTLSAAQAANQRQTLGAMQNRVVARVLGSASTQGVERFDFIPYMSLFVDAGELARLLRDPEVVSIQEDVPVPPALNESIPIIHANDVFAKGFNGTGRVVAILDTGVAKGHPMFAGGKVVSEACYSTNNPPNVSSLCPGGATSSTASGSGLNCPVALQGCDHGTHVASIAAGNSGKLDGVARDSQIIAIQVFSRQAAAVCNPNTAPCTGSFQTDQIKALQRVFALRNQFKIAAANMSLGGGSFNAACDAGNAALKTAIDNLRAAGIATIIASGNGSLTGSIAQPACISTAIAVGNTMKSDLVWRSSNHSAQVQLMAPGTQIKAAVPGNTYGVKTGTSMAAPHVAGAFALLKNAKPKATLDQILEALSCSGKTVHERFVSGGNPVELAPARPRIDMLGAYNFLKKPPNVVRSWSFADASQALDWTPFRGTWAISGGRYLQTPIATGWIGSSVANCNSALQVIASMTRIDPGTTIFSNSGLVLKTTLDYPNRGISGYWIAYNKCRTDDAGTCTGDAADPPGQAVLWRLDNFNFASNSGGASLLCVKQSAVKVNGLNTVKVVSNGSSHTYHLNGNLVCTVNDATYARGPVMAAAFIASSGGHAYQLETFSIKSMDVAPPLTAGIMDPASLAPKPAPGGMSPLGSSPR